MILLIIKKLNEEEAGMKATETKKAKEKGNDDDDRNCVAERARYSSRIPFIFKLYN